MFYSALDPQNKHKVVKRYVRNALAPVIVAELELTVAPRVIYTCL